MDANIVVPMLDGVCLCAGVYGPREPGRYPALVAWSAYPLFIQTSGAPAFNNESGVVGVTAAIDTRSKGRQLVARTLAIASKDPWHWCGTASTPSPIKAFWVTHRFLQPSSE